MKYLLDTNIVSEGGRPRPEPQVSRWMRQHEPDALFVSALTIGELVRGIAQIERRNVKSSVRLRAWFEGIRTDFMDRVIGIDESIAEEWGRLAAQRARPVVDGLLAATALVHGMTLVTRNVRAFEDTGALTLNPWAG